MIFFIINLMIIISYSNLITKDTFHMLQQNNYDKDFRYIKWVSQNITKISLKFLLNNIFIVIALIPMIFTNNSNVYANVFSIVVFATFFSIQYNKSKKIEIGRASCRERVCLYV